MPLHIPAKNDIMMIFDGQKWLKHNFKTMNIMHLTKSYEQSHKTGQRR